MAYMNLANLILARGYVREIPDTGSNLWEGWSLVNSLFARRLSGPQMLDPVAIFPCVNKFLGLNVQRPPCSSESLARFRVCSLTGLYLTRSLVREINSTPEGI